MFRKTSNDSQLGIFSLPDELLTGKTKAIYHDQNNWHNLFRQQVTSGIDENIFKPLFDEQNGAPNVSIRVLVAMMAIKEGFGWSDAQLFEQCRFNMLVRSALGLMNIDDEVPVESTYYLFRKRIVEHERQDKENLLERAFAGVTHGQAVAFEVSGKSIRMDSKLLGSNIAWLSRYELVHETLRLFYKDVKPLISQYVRDDAMLQLLEDIYKEKGNKVVFRSTRSETQSRLQELGGAIYPLLNLFNAVHSKHYETLNRVFSEQYRVEENKEVILRDKEEIQADSVQSPHDTDCHYRNKADKQTKGYSINATESCNETGLNLIADVAVKEAGAADSGYVQDTVKATENVLCGSIENLHHDGAYHSPDNEQFCESETIQIYQNAIQGMKGRYELELSENGLLVTDTHTDQTIRADKVKDKNKWKIKTEKGVRYFSEKEINTSQVRKRIAQTPVELLNVRNNVEATIFQIGYHYGRQKSRYRGLVKHKMWASMRCLWVNFVRIVNYVTSDCPKTVFSAIKGLISSFKTLYNCTFSFTTILMSEIKFPHPKNDVFI